MPTTSPKAVQRTRQSSMIAKLIVWQHTPFSAPLIIGLPRPFDREIEDVADDRKGFRTRRESFYRALVGLSITVEESGSGPEDTSGGGNHPAYAKQRLEGGERVRRRDCESEHCRCRYKVVIVYKIWYKESPREK